MSAAPTPAALIACPNNLEPNNFISNFPIQMTSYISRESPNSSQTGLDIRGSPVSLARPDVQFGQLSPPRHLEYVVTSIGDLGAAARDWVSERTDYPRNVAQLALRMKPIAASSMSTSTGRPKNSVSTMPTLKAPRMSDKSFERACKGGVGVGF
ncbi:hypothetical protein [Bradyrhizobium sp. AUGA SZCCT0283]|uniref:hypothetical protein n=1 Tax=Bradyrhizobium sp. AUGA SZCCT0283 TaxID=2807671 RepID=UPI001BA61DFD|nr:hypothetical protein [Bradyrhizobium sp. AUGA SZCCT0283]MBR1280261.1 hypothetical protein [Bradyrhizobium sp. AUGA SZCCT0283]